MRILYHMSLDPGSRLIRLILAEKGLDFELKSEKVWERREGFLRLNPAGEVPVLIEEDGTVLPDTLVILEFLEELYPERNLLGVTPHDRAEVRRLLRWFDSKFAAEVSGLLLEEKIMKRFLGQGTPTSTTIRAANQNIHYHLDYIGWLNSSAWPTWRRRRIFPASTISATCPGKITPAPRIGTPG